MYEPANNIVRIKKFELIIELITRSFGKNPVSGGIPANDNIKITTINGIKKWILYILNKSKIVFELVIINRIKIGVTVKQYIKK